MDRCETVKVKPWTKDQGEFVEVNADEFDPAVHELLDAPPARKKKAAD